MASKVTCNSQPRWMRGLPFTAAFRSSIWRAISSASGIESAFAWGVPTISVVPLSRATRSIESVVSRVSAPSSTPQKMWL